MHELRAHGLQRVLLFLALRLRDHDHGLEAHRVRDEREPDTGVSGGAFHDGAAGPERAARDGVFHDEQRRAVFHRLAWVQEFRLAQDFAAGVVRRAAQPDERRVADGGDDGRLDGGAGRV